MDARMILDVLNELLVLEQASLARRFLESTVFVSHMTIEALTTVHSMARADEEHSARLTDAIIRLGGVPGLRFADPGTSDLHYLEINHALPRLLADREALVRKYTTAMNHITAEPLATDVVARILDQHTAELTSLQQLVDRRAAAAS
jgi:bacterioferritin (cytochrome b1)